ESGAGEEGEGSQETSASSVEPSEVRFLVEHLDWLQELNRLVYSFTEESRGSFAGKFYRTVADVTVAFVAHERESYLRREM
ncbi:MAG: hypothetical protein HZA13_03180, partial [Nitrospirae bacterium]|nr:hypothetical protein [Nitrospirota bacterium]